MLTQNQKETKKVFGSNPKFQIASCLDVSGLYRSPPAPNRSFPFAPANIDLKSKGRNIRDFVGLQWFLYQNFLFWRGVSFQKFESNICTNQIFPKLFWIPKVSPTGTTRCGITFFKHDKHPVKSFPEPFFWKYMTLDVLHVARCFWCFVEKSVVFTEQGSLWWLFTGVCWMDNSIAQPCRMKTSKNHPLLSFRDKLLVKLRPPSKTHNKHPAWIGSCPKSVARLDSVKVKKP